MSVRLGAFNAHYALRQVLSVRAASRLPPSCRHGSDYTSKALPLGRPLPSRGIATQAAFRPSTRHSGGHSRCYSTISQLSEPCTEIEADNAKILQVAKIKVDEYREARKANLEELDVGQQIERSRTLKDFGSLADGWARYQKLRKGILDVRLQLSDDSDRALRDMFRTEHDTLCTELDELITIALPSLLLPPLPDAHLPTIMQFTAGVGGAQASIFVEDLVRMYKKFAARRGWKVTTMSEEDGPSQTGGLGFREVTMKLEPGKNHGGDPEECYGWMMFEKGVHRIQDISKTDTKMRLHTSAAGIVVLPVPPEQPDTPVFDKKDIRDEVMRAGGKGGQHVNKTESAVRLTHVPTGISVSIQETRSQHENRALAYQVLTARLKARRRAEEQEKRSATRQSQVKTGDRSEKVRTYNFPQDRLTDHRVNFTLIGLSKVMEGDRELDLVIEALRTDLQNRRLEALLAGEEDLEE